MCAPGEGYRAKEQGSYTQAMASATLAHGLQFPCLLCVFWALSRLTAAGCRCLRLSSPQSRIPSPHLPPKVHAAHPTKRLPSHPTPAPLSDYLVKICSYALAFVHCMYYIIPRTQRLANGSVSQRPIPKHAEARVIRTRFTGRRVPAPDLRRRRFPPPLSSPSSPSHRSYPCHRQSHATACRRDARTTKAAPASHACRPCCPLQPLTPNLQPHTTTPRLPPPFNPPPSTFHRFPLSPRLPLNW